MLPVRNFFFSFSCKFFAFCSISPSPWEIRNVSQAFSLTVQKVFHWFRKPGSVINFGMFLFPLFFASGVYTFWRESSPFPLLAMSFWVPPFVLCELTFLCTDCLFKSVHASVYMVSIEFLLCSFLISKIDDPVPWLAFLIAVYSHIKALPSWISLRNQSRLFKKVLPLC